MPPRPRAAILRERRSTIASGVSTFTLTTIFLRASGTSSQGPESAAAALKTSMPISSVSSPSRIFSTFAVSARSQRIARTSMPCAAFSAFAWAFSPAASRSSSTRSRPLCAKRSAYAIPMPSTEPAISPHRP